MTESESPHDEQVRRLLAGARHDTPIPPEVAARLDGVLADLRAEQAAGPPVPPPPLGPPPPPPAPPGPPAPVVDLAARRRRKQGAALLLAAAAVVAIGVGVGSMVDDTSGGDDGASAGSASDESFERAEPDAADEGGGSAPSAAAPSEAPPSGLMRMQPLVVSSDTFAADAERYRARTDAAPPPAAQEGEDSAFPCDIGTLGPGVHVPVLYDGMEAVLAYRPPTDDSQVVDLLQCGTGDVVRTTTLPVP